MSTKRAFSDLTASEKAIELLRWLAVLPAALLGRLTIKIVLGLLMRFARPAGWFVEDQSGVLYYLLLLIFYGPKEAAFVIVGAKIAPRRRIITSVSLAVAAILMSLMIHVLGQNNPGVINYTHFIAESIGAISGATYIFISETKARRSAHRSAGDV